jgi:hypothetical protein
MQHRAGVDVAGKPRQEIVLERQHACLLLLAVGRDALIVPPPELGRVEVVEDLAIARGERLVPRGGAAPRDDDQAVGSDAEPLGKPPEKRRPIEQLEADLTEPGSGNDGLRPGRAQRIARAAPPAQASCALTRCRTARGTIRRTPASPFRQPALGGFPIGA